jgi:hypothetical protein
MLCIDWGKMFVSVQGGGSWCSRLVLTLNQPINQPKQPTKTDQIAEHVLRQHSYRAPGEDATHGPTEPGILSLLGDRDCKQATAAPVWLRGAAAALAGGRAGGMEEPELLPGADTIEEYYEVGGLFG